MSSNRVIGRGNDLPWHLGADLKRFKELTVGKTCVMGRKTFESILGRLNKPLPNRRTVVVTGSGYGYDHPDVTIVPTLQQALVDGVVVCGGASVYEQALARCGVMHLTILDRTVEGDAYFPSFDENAWRISDEQVFTDPEKYRFLTFTRNG